MLTVRKSSPYPPFFFCFFFYSQKFPFIELGRKIATLHFQIRDEIFHCVEQQARLIGNSKYDEALNTILLHNAGELVAAFPIHEPHFHFALDILLARRSIQAWEDLWDPCFIFFGDGAEKFVSYLSETDPSVKNTYISLTLPFSFFLDRTDKIFDSDYLPMPDLKHGFALAVLFPCYKRLTVMDSEIVIIKPSRLMYAVQQRLSHRRVFGMVSPFMSYWMEFYGAQCVSAADVNFVKDQTNHFSLFLWWNDIPAYSSILIPHYLSYINYPRVCPILSFELWLTIYHGWTVINLSENLGLNATGLECLSDTTMLERWVAAYPPGPLWIPNRFCILSGKCNTSSSFYNNSYNFVAINHVDRALDNPTTIAMCVKPFD